MRRAALALLLTTMFAAPVFAADGEALGESAILGASGAASRLAADVDWSMKPVSVGEAPNKVLPGLYVSLAALNTYDMLTTIKGTKAGATEANPLMRGVVKSSPALFGVKAASTGAAIFLAERLRRNGHNGQAMMVMILSNSVMATVAANNARVVSAR
jgi:hypothetical protein